MKNRSTFLILLKKSLKDLKSNFKQFISIIFIIAIAVTLFVGLQANYKSLERRVNEFYKDGNVASFWLTYALVDEEEKTNLENLLTFCEHEMEDRLTISAKVEGVNVNLAVSPTYPSISKANKLYLDGTSNENLYKEVSNTPNNKEDYFIVDKALFTFLYEDPSREEFENKYKVNDSELEISIPTSNYATMIYSLTKEVIGFIESIADPTYFDITLLDEFKNNILNYIDTFFEEHPSIKFKSKFTNYMNHPENIAVDKTSTQVALMSQNRLIDSVEPLVDKILVEFKKMLAEVDPSLPIVFEQYLQDLSKDLIYSSNQVLIKVDDEDANKAGEVLNTYFNKTSNENKLVNRLLFFNDLDNLVSNITVQNDLKQAEALSFTFPILFLIVAILIVITTISQLILKERTQIGTFKALGLTKREIIFHYLITTLSLGVAGCIIGMILGPVILPGIMDIKYLILYSITPTSYTFPIVASFATLLVVLAMIALITYLIIKKELKATPSESIRPAIPKINLKARKTKNETKFISLKMALRNMKVYFTKSIMVIIGILGCTGLLVCGFGIEDTIDYGIEHDLTTFFNYDIMTTYADYTLDNTQAILDNPEVNTKLNKEEYYKISTLPITFYLNEATSYSNTIFVVEQELFDKDIITIDFAKNTVALAQSQAEKLSLNVGDEIFFKILGKEYKREISLIYEDFSMKSMFIHAEDTLDGDAFMKYAKDYVTCAYFKVIEGLSEDEIKEVVSDIKNMDISVTTCMSYLQTKEKINTYVSAVKLMTLAVKIFAILLAIVCLINLALLNFKERTREIATLKVLGFSNFEISRSLIYEILILTLIGSVIGLGFGYPMEWLVLSVNENNLVSFIYYIAPITLIIGVVLSLITSFVVNAILSLFIRKVPMVESLKSVE